MPIFNKLSEPIFLKTSSSAENQLEQLQAVDKERLPDDVKERLEREIKLVSMGIKGEQNVDFELRNSHIPMYVLHDLYLEHGELSAQIDYLIITRGCSFVIECKNLYGNIEVNSKGDFIRAVEIGKRTQKEGIYSPITQNRRHLELIKEIRGEEKGFLTKGVFEKNFYNNYRSIVVLANPKTILNDRYAKKEIKGQIIRADGLCEYVRQINISRKKDGIESSDDDMKKLAQFFLSKHIEHDIDYAEKYRECYITPSVPISVTTSIPIETAALPPNIEAQENPTDFKLCPKCGAEMVLRTAKKSDKAGKQFWGCSKFPKCRGIINVS